MRAIARGIGAAALLGATTVIGLGCPSNGSHGTAGGGGTAGSTGTGGEAAPAWQTVFDGEGLGGAVLSAWGPAPDDVYVVGGPLGDSGFDAVVMHFDGKAWKKLTPGGADSFWWVSGSGPHDVWMVGEHGRITHFDGMSFTEQPRPTTATIWGVWAASPTDAWAVAGTPEGGTSAANDLIFHWDGSAWKPEALPGAPLGVSLNKIWGTGSDNLYAVGEAGTVWHRKGTTWALESNPPIATSTLLTVNGCSATDVYAVGGNDVLHSNGTTWKKVDVALGNLANGVTCDPASGEVLVVGFGGLKQRLVSGTWINDFASAPYGDLHGAWADGHGSFWVAGGDFVSKATAGKDRRTVIGRFGSGAVPPITP